MAPESPEKIKVFFSHKKEDEKLAEFIREKFLFYGGSRLEFKMFEQIPSGQDWRDWIIEEVRTSKLLFFLAPRPNADLS